MADQLALLRMEVPDFVADVDEDSGTWTAVVPSACGPDDGREVTGTLAEVVEAGLKLLEDRRTATRKSLRAQLDVLVMAWGDRARIGWDGAWWYERLDGAGHRQEAPTPEDLTRLLGDEFSLLPFWRREGGVMHASRDMGKATGEQLTGIQQAATRLLDDYERFMGADLVEALCLWREAAARQEKRGQSTASVMPIRPKQAS